MDCDYTGYELIVSFINKSSSGVLNVTDLDGQEFV
jgi:hypothetical protein